MVAPATEYLDLGMYTPSEAAMYARVQTQLIARWVHGSGAGQPALRAQLHNPQDKTITFLDFVQTLAVRAIRDAKSVPLSKIREAVDIAQEKGIDYPFARKHTTYLFGREVFIEVPDIGLIQATGKHARQYAMKPVLELYLEDLSFGPDGLASSYLAYEKDGVEIVMDPHFNFGEPTIKSSGYTAQTLWHACRIEGSFEAAAEAYGVLEPEVRVAYRYIDSLRTASAA